MRVQIWGRRGTVGSGEQVGKGKGDREEWKVIKEVEIDLARLKRWNGKVSRAPFP